MFCERAAKAAAVVFLVAFVLGCNRDECIRNSDCNGGLVCSNVGVCMIAPVDGSAGDGGLPDGSDSGVDASVDAGLDAGLDAGVDGGLADAGPDAAPDAAVLDFTIGTNPSDTAID